MEEQMSAEMDRQNRRAEKILRRFAGYVKEAAAVAADLEQPAIERRQPRKFAQIKRRVAWRLMARGKR